MFESPKRHHHSNGTLTRDRPAGKVGGSSAWEFSGYPVGGHSTRGGIRHAGFSGRDLKRHHLSNDTLARHRLASGRSAVTLGRRVGPGWVYIRRVKGMVKVVDD